MAIEEIPAEVVGDLIPNTGNRVSDPRDFRKLLQSDLMKRVEMNPTEVVGKFVANTKDPRVYDPRKLGEMVLYILIDLLVKLLIREDDSIKELKEDDKKHEVNRHDDYSREELDCKSTTRTAAEYKENGNPYTYEDILVKDEETGAVYSAIKLILSNAKLNDRLINTDELTIKEVGDLIEQNKITAPGTNNKLSPPYRLNALYNASKDPINTSGDISKKLFDHCHSELISSRAKFPYGLFQLYTDTRPETARGQRIFRLKDPKGLQLVYYVNHSDKSHPGYLKYQNLTILMFTMDMQNSKESPKLISLRDAVSQGIVSNQVVAYLIGTVYEHFRCIGMSEKLRFKQQSDAECWVAEIKCYGAWIECTRISEAVRRFDLSAFGNHARKVAEALEEIVKEEEMARKMMADLQSGRNYKIFVGTLQKDVIIEPGMLIVTNEKKTIYKRVSTYVAEVSFRIGRMVCCLYEHAYNPKQGKYGTPLDVFSFPPLVAPYKCFVIENKEYEATTKLTNESLDEAGISYMIVAQGKHPWKKLMLSDECGCPFAVRVYSKDLVTIRERDSNRKISVKVDEVRRLIEDLLSGVITWTDICEKYPCAT